VAIFDKEGEEGPDGVDEEEDYGGCAEREDHDAAAHVVGAGRERLSGRRVGWTKSSRSSNTAGSSTVVGSTSYQVIVSPNLPAHEASAVWLLV